MVNMFRHFNLYVWFFLLLNLFFGCKKEDSNSAFLLAFAASQAANGCSGTPGEVVTIAGGYPYAGGFLDGSGNAARFSALGGLTVKDGGVLYIADYGNHALRQIDVALNVTTQAGAYPTPVSGLLDQDGASARFHNPMDVVVDSSGNIFAADRTNNAIRKITSAGIVTTIAGAYPTPSSGHLDGIGNAARFAGPSGITIDRNDNLYIADQITHSIKKVTPTGTVTTLAGAYPTPTAGLVDAVGLNARFNLPHGITIDTAGNLYVADSGNHAIRKITPAGVVTTVAGAYPSPTAGYVDAVGASARFRFPRGIAIDSAGNVYVSDSENAAIRKITPSGMVITIAGAYPTATVGLLDGTGLNTRFTLPHGNAMDAHGNLYVADFGNSAVRRINCVKGL